MRKRGFNDIEYCDNYALLHLTDWQGELVAKTKVDVCDLPRLREFGMRWYANHSHTSRPCAQLRMTREGGKVYFLHRFLLDAPKGVVVDHINGDPLDNRRSNLRLVTYSQNSQNRRPDKDSRTGIKNVCWDNSRNKYRVYLMVRGKNKTYGYYDSLEDAAARAQEVRLLLHTHSPDHRAG